MITITLAFGSMKSFFHFSLSFTVAAQSENLFLPYQLSRTAEQQSKKYSGSQHMSAVVREGAPLGLRVHLWWFLKCPQILRYSSLQEVEPNFPPLECGLDLVT